MLENVKDVSDLTRPGGVIQEMVKGTIERILKAEQEAPRLRAPQKTRGYGKQQTQRGYSKKNLKTSQGPYFSFPAEIKKMIYTTNAVEALHRQFRKVTKTRGAFLTDNALKKMLYLATLDLMGSLRRKREWPTMLVQLKIIFEERIPDGM